MPLLSWEQFIDWQARYDQEPWGESRADMRANASVLNSFAPHLDESSRATLPKMFFPYADSDEVTLDVVATVEGLDAMASIYDG